MKKYSLPCALSVLFFWALSGAAWAQDTTPQELKGLAETLKQIKIKRAASEKSLETKVEQDFRTASASNAAAIAFYDRAVQAIQADKARPDLQEWEKSEAAQNAARLHISYLLLTLQRANGATTKQLEPALLAHIGALTAAGAGDDNILYRRERNHELKEAGYNVPNGKAKNAPGHEPLFWDQDLIKQSVKGSIFVQWYGISKMFEPAKDWEFAPGNVDGIYQSTLLPYYRQTKDPRILTYWDNKIQKETQEASKSTIAFKVDQFNNIQRPRLVWKRAQDMIAIGQRNRGMGEMVTLIKTYPDHPDLADWITQIEEMLPKPSVPEASPATPVQAPPPPAAPVN